MLHKRPSWESLNVLRLHGHFAGSLILYVDTSSISNLESQALWIHLISACAENSPHIKTEGVAQLDHYGERRFENCGPLQLIWPSIFQSSSHDESESMSIGKEYIVENANPKSRVAQLWTHGSKSLRVQMIDRLFFSCFLCQRLHSSHYGKFNTCYSRLLIFYGVVFTSWIRPILIRAVLVKSWMISQRGCDRYRIRTSKIQALITISISKKPDVLWS